MSHPISPAGDVLPGFQKPPPGYGEVPFYWWVGDPLTKERLLWQLDQLAGHGIMGLQVNYAHTDQGGVSYGLSIPSDPPLFSEAWWELFGWFMGEAKKRGMAVSLSDYTLGLGQGWVMDGILRNHPELHGSVLEAEIRELTPGEEAPTEPPSGALMAAVHGERLVVVRAKAVVPSLDPMNPLSGAEYVERFFGQFERRFPGECGKGLNFFFSDELEFRVGGNIWTGRFAAEFQRRKGYDLVPELPALFMDIGPRTAKVRLDYSDVKVALTEESFFQPVYEWHQRRGMTYGCDHGGRGRNVVEFGDYFRTQRWNQGPGCDQPKLGRDLIKNKVASSMAHLYQRPRVWLEGFYSSGWGTSSAAVADATFANFAQGQNLLTLHGLYYSTHGGWWEWAPPCNHFRQPYWRHMPGLMACVERLSYLLSQGLHRCDVAILYPVAPMEAGLGGKEAVACAFDTGRALYRQGVDFDFMDFESLDRAELVGDELRVSGESYKALVLPAMRALRFSTLQKALAFQRAGGVVLIVGALPEASDRVGADDPELRAMVAEIAVAPLSLEEAVARIGAAFPRDFAALGQVPDSLNFMHRRVGPRDVYMLHGAPQGTECQFRATGNVELWNPWTGEASPLPVLSQTATHSVLRLPLSGQEPQLIVFSPGQAVFESEAVPGREIAIDGPWGCELVPTLDNRWGDYRWPAFDAMIGAEARRFDYQASPDGAWTRATHAFGPMFRLLGPLSAAVDEGSLFPGDPAWRDYEFSWRWGVEGDPGHQGYHGLKEEMYDEFIRLGKLVDDGYHDYRREAEENGSIYYLWTTVMAPSAMLGTILVGGMRPSAVWVNGQAVSSDKVSLKAGHNPVLLRYDGVGAGYFLVVEPGFAMPGPKTGELSMRWLGASGILPFDVCPTAAAPVGRYRFKSAPGMRSFIAAPVGKVRAWVDGEECQVSELGGGKLRFVPARPARGEASVELRVEHERGVYGGAVFPEPIAFECGEGEIHLGDWSKLEGLESYSGGLRYRKTITVPPETLGGKLILDLGEVESSAELRVNGEALGARTTSPWRWDVTGKLKPGENLLEVLVFNTMGNHYLTIPTRYRGASVSGMLGPARLISSP